ncbi:Uncharacterised protein [uncultured archaeon]|nr:Uncharacterised protein [uncultured archaeon]
MSLNNKAVKPSIDVGSIKRIGTKDVLYQDMKYVREYNLYELRNIDKSITIHKTKTDTYTLYNSDLREEVFGRILLSSIKVEDVNILPKMITINNTEYIPVKRNEIIFNEMSLISQDNHSLISILNQITNENIKEYVEYSNYKIEELFNMSRCCYIDFKCEGDDNKRTSLPDSLSIHVKGLMYIQYSDSIFR